METSVKDARSDGMVMICDGDELGVHDEVGQDHRV